MGQSKQERYETERAKIERTDKIGDDDRDRIIAYLDAADGRTRAGGSLPEGDKTKAPGTLHQHANSILRVTKDLHHRGNSLTECTTHDINRLMDDYLSGDVDSCKDSGLSEGTVNNRQGPLRVFYRFHSDLGIESDDLTLGEIGDTSVNEDDLFTKNEVHLLREAAKTSGSRDICLIDLLLYTGQRLSAILHLRLKDVNPEEGTFTLNEEDGDLKGASGKRPLLGAQQSVMDWKRQHPTGKPDDYLITAKASQITRDDVTAGGRMSASGIHRILKQIGRNADVDKPVNAHNYRHTFVTVAIRDYGMDKDTVKHLIGHEPGSTVMEETYQHLTDEDYIENAEVATGIREPDDESPLTPSICNRCGEPLDGDWKTCPYCGMVYAPDVYDAKEQVEDDLWKDKSETEVGSPESEAVDALKDLLDERPEAVADLLREAE